MIEYVSMEELERRWRQSKTLRHWRFESTYGLGPHFLSDDTGRVVVAATTPARDWVPVPASIDEAREIVRKAREYCQRNHTKDDDHRAFCFLNLCNGSRWGESGLSAINAVLGVLDRLVNGSVDTQD